MKRGSCSCLLYYDKLEFPLNVKDNILSSHLSLLLSNESVLLLLIQAEELTHCCISPSGFGPFDFRPRPIVGQVILFVLARFS